jgi:hypothetical protein
MINFASFFKYPYAIRMDKLVGILKIEDNVEKSERLGQFILDEIYLEAPFHAKRNEVFKIAVNHLAEVNQRLRNEVEALRSDNQTLRGPT